MTTLIVLASGRQQRRIARVARKQAALDPDRRRVIVAPRPGGPSAVMVDERNEIRVALDLWHATTPALIEDAFLQAQRAEARERTLPASFS